MDITLGLGHMSWKIADGYLFRETLALILFRADIHIVHHYMFQNFECNHKLATLLVLHVASSNCLNI